jgi:hypothetical protein
MGPYNTPAIARAVATTDGPMPQYHAEKAIAGKSRTYAARPPTQGSSPLFNRRAVITAAIARR